MRAARSGSREADMLRRVAAFRTRAQETGKSIEAPTERDAAQAILDYWTAWLFTFGDRSALSAAPAVLAPHDPSHEPDLQEKANPYQGLEAFQEEDGRELKGRGEAKADLLERVLRYPVVFVSGPVGSGKTSLVLAGVLPDLKAHLALEAKDPIVTVMIPGTDPLRALVRAVGQAARNPATEGVWLAEQKRRIELSPRRLRKIVESLGPGRPLLLIVDQFEELFTLAEPTARDQFARAIASLVEEASTQNKIILITREDYAATALNMPALVDFAKEPGVSFSPPPPSRAELLEIITSGANTAGLKIDNAVVEDLVKAIVGDAAALPTLQFTLRKLWERRERNRVTWDAYHKVGRPREALQRAAEDVFSQLDAEERRAAHKIFLELVRPTMQEASSRDEFIRPRIRWETLSRLDGVTPQQVNRVVDSYVSAGLLRKTAAADKEDERFEIAHEALLYGWDRLARWLVERRQESQEKWQFVAKARLYRQHRGDPAYLLRGRALRDAEKYADSASEVRELVNQSRNAEKWRLTILILAPISLILGALLAVVLLRAYEDRYVPHVAAHINSLNATDDDIRWLADKRQQLDFARLVRQGYDLRRLKAVGPKFTGSRLKAMQFSDAILPAAIFTQSTIDESGFKNADLTNARFEEATISHTPFSGAKLARAIFDRANLNGVDFSGADIGEASFRNAIIDEKFAGFGGTAWWLAVGWTEGQIDSLNSHHPRKAFIESEIFRGQRSELEAKIDRAREKAFLLNDLAWLLATHGTDLDVAEAKINQALSTFAPNDAKGELSKTWYANFNDTLGYILMQKAAQNSGNEQMAKELLERAEQAFKASVEQVPSGERLFRYAMCLFQLKKKDEAVKSLESATLMGYVPSHENYLLTSYVRGDFQQLVKQVCRKLPSCQ
ncbi:nSTAND1 domain-containing NTPase [Bradyrhizobium liaoningense]